MLRDHGSRTEFDRQHHQRRRWRWPQRHFVDRAGHLDVRANRCLAPDTINQARSLVASVQGIFTQMEGVMRIPVNSATLPATQQFEQNLLSRDPNQIAQTGTQYTAVYGAIPDATAASPQTRDLVDMTDAAAQAAMKRAIEIDALADLELQAADQINQSIAAAAPGSAPIIEAQADAWLVRANAYTQSATADLMRVRAVDLADASATVKNGAANSTAIQQQIYNILKRP